MSKKPYLIDIVVDRAVELAFDDYDPSEAREDDGKWTSGGGSSAGGSAKVSTEKAAVAHKPERLALSDTIDTLKAGAPAYYQLLKDAPKEEHFDPESTWMHVTAAVKDRKYIQVAKEVGKVAAKHGYGVAHREFENRGIDPLIEAGAVAVLLYCGMENPLTVALATAVAGYTVEKIMDKYGLGEDDSREIACKLYEGVSSTMKDLATTEMHPPKDHGTDGLEKMIERLKNASSDELHKAANGIDDLSKWAGRLSHVDLQYSTGSQK